VWLIGRHFDVPLIVLILAMHQLTHLPIGFGLNPPASYPAVRTLRAKDLQSMSRYEKVARVAADPVE